MKFIYKDEYKKPVKDFSKVDIYYERGWQGTALMREISGWIRKQDGNDYVVYETANGFIELWFSNSAYTSMLALSFRPPDGVQVVVK